VDPGTFKGKMVLVGATAKGVGDFYVTPFTARLPGVEKHANVADCILKKDFILRDWRVALRDQIIVLCVGLITGLLLAFLTASMGLCAVVVLWGLMAWYCYSQFAYHGVWHNMTYPSLTIFLTFCLVLAYRFGTEARRRREVKRVFEQYMQASVVTDLLRRADEVKLGGDVREVTVFFSDLAGFSTISETLTPQGVIAFLNECYDQMAPAILERNAFLDKFWGDAIVAAFGVPMGDKDHAIQACLAALDCQGRLDQLNERLAAQGKPQAKARIGLHSGPAVVGNVGSHVAKRFNYTALGDAVNLGARLESANKDFQTSILMSQSTYSLAKYVVEARELGKIVVKGRKEPVPVYELLGEINRVPGHRLVLADIFRHGLNLYMKRDWDGAIFAFQKALAHSPKDGPALLYLRACKVLKANPPPENWDGILVMKEGKD
jgi:adenylate cyclase